MKKVKIEELDNLIKKDIKKLINDDVNKIGHVLIAESPTVYTTQLGTFKGTPSNPVMYPNGMSNIVGEYKNSWCVVHYEEDAVQRKADPTGFDSSEDVRHYAENNFDMYDVHIVNGAEYQDKVVEKYKVIKKSIPEVVKHLGRKYKVL